jgi:hypothetical protein
VPSHDKGRNRCIDHPRKSAQPHSADTYLQRQPYLTLLSPLQFLDAVFLQSLQKPANLTDRFETRTLRSNRMFCVWSLEFCDFPTIVSPCAKPKTETTSGSGTERSTPTLRLTLRVLSRFSIYFRMARQDLIADGVNCAAAAAFKKSRPEDDWLAAYEAHEISGPLYQLYRHANCLSHSPRPLFLDDPLLFGYLGMFVRT